MQTAPRRAVDAGPKKVEVIAAPPTRARRRLRPITIIIAALVSVLSLGAMLAVARGLWPFESNSSVVTSPTPTSLYASGIVVEKVGEPRTEGDQIIVPLKVTNKVIQPGPVVGTPSAQAPTPTAGPANVNNATVKVIFYNRPASDSSRKIVGSAIGNVQDLKYGESKQIDVVATGVGEFCKGCYEAFPDTVWTDKDAVKATPAP